MFGWIRPKKIKRRWYLEGRGTGPLSRQDKEMWQTRDQGYKGKGVAENAWQYLWV